MFIANPSYPLMNWNALNDTPLIRLTPLSWVQPRRESAVVLPSETSPNIDLQWVKPGYAYFRHTIAKEIRYCIFIGVSYWRCDRAEMDFILESLDRNTTVVSANPHPDPDFVTKVASFGLMHTQWWPDPEPLDA
jgi:hypothetical protein